MAPKTTHSNIALMRSCGGAGRDDLSAGHAPRGWPTGRAPAGSEWSRRRQHQQHVCGPVREIEPLTRSSRGSLPPKGSRAGAAGSPNRSLPSLHAVVRGARLQIAQERAADSVVKRSGVGELLALLAQVARLGRMGHGLTNQIHTHHRIPSVAGRTMHPAALGRMGKGLRKIP